MTLAEAIRTLRTNVRMFPNLALAALIVYAAAATEVGVLIGVRTKSIVFAMVAGDVISTLAVVATFALFMLIASNPTLYARCQRLADRFVNDYPVSVPENDDDEQVSVADYDRGYDSGSDDYEYIAGEEEEDTEEKDAEAYAYKIAPLGCTCGNNGGGDCEWCSAKEDWLINDDTWRRDAEYHNG